MQKILIAATVLCLSGVPAFAANAPACTDSSLSSTQAHIGNLTGRAQKKATRELEAAKLALKDGNAKKCSRIMARIEASLAPSTAAPAKSAPAQQPSLPDEADPLPDEN